MPKQKSLSERVYERHCKKKAHVNKVAVIALYQEIEEAVKKGCSLKSIWETLHEEKKLNFSYAAFTNHFKNIKKSQQQNSSVQPINDAIARKEDLL